MEVSQAMEVSQSSIWFAQSGFRIRPGWCCKDSPPAPRGPTWRREPHHLGTGDPRQSHGKSNGESRPGSKNMFFDELFHEKMMAGMRVELCWTEKQLQLEALGRCSLTWTKILIWPEDEFCKKNAGIPLGPYICFNANYPMGSDGGTSCPCGRSQAAVRPCPEGKSFQPMYRSSG